MLSITTIPVTVFSQNARIVGCSETRSAVIVDPGGDAEIILDTLRSTGFTCAAIWLTHSHLDHCAGVQHILDALPVPVVAHPIEQSMRAHVQKIAAMYGLPPSEWSNCPEPTIPVYGGETLSVGSHTATVLFTPGHSPGHVAFYFAEDKVLVSGDTLFRGSIGRTDLPGGNHEQLIASIQREIVSLPDDTRVLSGHGDDTTVGEERRTNPFLA